MISRLIQTSLMSLVSAAFVFSALVNQVHAASINASISVLVKTESSSEVYWIKNGEKHSFPNYQVYKSWFNTFDSVKLVSEKRLASIPSGKPISVKPGSAPLMFTGNNSVYYVTKEYTLKTITSPEIAEKRFGKDWQSKIIVLPSTYQNDYQIK